MIKDPDDRPVVRLHLWLETERGIFFGLGRLKLLEKIQSGQSLKGAAQSLGMSYRAAWGKIKKTEEILGTALIEKKGGNRAGYPINQGALCAKGASMLSMTRNEHRLKKPLYRAPGSDRWQEQSWQWTLEQIAQRIKQSRDTDLILKNDKGQTVAALAESFGRGAMTNHWIDIKNADAVLIMGSNAAEHHPISFKWVLQAKDKGAVVIHVDPKFSRTSARSSFHVPLRSGTDTAFLGGMIKHIIDSNRYFKDYVVEYTNAAFIVNKGFGFKDGLFSGYDPKTRKYDKATWAFEMDSAGLPRKDKTMKDPHCVFQLLKKHYARYSLDKVASVTGVSKQNLLEVYQAYSATGAANKAGTVMYALGWTQHTVGVQNIRAACIVQLLLGNIGVAGGGINALRGEPNVQGSTDHALLYHILPGYLPMPIADWPTLADYQKATTPVTQDPKSANWWQNRPKYMVSLLKGWFGDRAGRQTVSIPLPLPACATSLN